MDEPYPTPEIFKEPETLRGLQLYVELSEKILPELTAWTVDLYRTSPAFRPLMEKLPQERMHQQNVENTARIRQAAFEGNWEPYLGNLRTRGIGFAKAGVTLKDWTSVHQRTLTWLIDRVFQADGGGAEWQRVTLKGVSCLSDTVIHEMAQVFMEAQGDLIRDQQKAILTLSTPVLVVADRVLLAPLIGELNEGRIALLRLAMLGSIRFHRARVVVLDVTGVASIDTAVAQRLGQCIGAARLMGARVLISGLSSEISQAMVLLGVDLPGAETYSSLQSALADALAVPPVSA